MILRRAAFDTVYMSCLKKKLTETFPFPTLTSSDPKDPLSWIINKATGKALVGLLFGRNVLPISLSKMPSPRQQSKKDKKDIAFLNSLTADHAELIDTPKSHFLFIGAVECISTGLPIGLFFTQYYHADSLLEASPQFAIGTIVGAIILAFAVNRWAVAVRKALHTEREAAISTKTSAEKSVLKQSAFVERSAQSAAPPATVKPPKVSPLFPPPHPPRTRTHTCTRIFCPHSTAAAMSSLNLCYFLSYLVLATYVLPSHKLSDKVRVCDPASLLLSIASTGSPPPALSAIYCLARCHSPANSVPPATTPPPLSLPFLPYQNNYMFSSTGAALASLVVGTLYHSIKL